MNLKPCYYSPSELLTIEKDQVPHHVAFIPDGNRRWAKNKEKECQEGHKSGSDNLIEVVKAGKELGIKVFTFYLFSTENWNRAEDEVNALMWLLNDYLIEQRTTFLNEGTRLCTIGDLSKLPVYVQDTISLTKEITKDCQDVDLVFALNYGGRDELVRSFKKLHEALIQNKMAIEEVTEKTLQTFLDTANWQDPDLLIRTSGELRISNYLLWQLSYTEIYSTDVLWPDFSKDDLLLAIKCYQQRERRRGGS